MTRARWWAYVAVLLATLATVAVRGDAGFSFYGPEPLLALVGVGAHCAWFYFDGRVSEAPGIAAAFVAVIVVGLGAIGMVAYFVLTRGWRGVAVWVAYYLGMLFAGMGGWMVHEVVALFRQV